MAARSARAPKTERMRRSYAEFEAALAEETVEERQRAERLRRDAAAKKVAENYMRFVKVYEAAEAAQPAGA